MWSRSPQANPAVHLSELSRQNLQWALSALATPPKRILHSLAGRLSNWGHKSPEYSQWSTLAQQGTIRVVETDASGETGWSYHMCHSGVSVSGQWPPSFAADEGIPVEKADINYKELWVIVRCISDQAAELGGWRVLFRTDNTCAVHYTNVRYGAIPTLERLAVRLEAAERQASCWALAAHIRGVANRAADIGSRDPFFSSRWNSDPFRSACVRDRIFQDIVSRTGVSFTLDLFADRAGLTAKAPTWRSPEFSAFEASLQGEVVWAHPPRELLRATLDFLNAALLAPNPPKILLMCPEDPGAPWFRSGLLRCWHRVRSWPAGSDLFKFHSGLALRNGPRTDLPYLLLQSWEPNRRKRKRS